jgi:hypothetical protein
MFRLISKIDIDTAFDVITILFLAGLFGGALLKAASM